MFLVERSAFRTLVRGRAFASQSAFSNLAALLMDAEIPAVLVN